MPYALIPRLPYHCTVAYHPGADKWYEVPNSCPRIMLLINAGHIAEPIASIIREMPVAYCRIIQ